MISIDDENGGEIDVDGLAVFGYACGASGGSRVSVLCVEEENQDGDRDGDGVAFLKSLLLRVRWNGLWLRKAGLQVRSRMVDEEPKGDAVADSHVSLQLCVADSHFSLQLWRGHRRSQGHRHGDRGDGYGYGYGMKMNMKRLGLNLSSLFLSFYRDCHGQSARRVNFYGYANAGQ